MRILLLSATVPAVTFTDFAPGNNFKLNVGVTLQTGCTAAPTGSCCIGNGTCVAGQTAAQCLVLNPNPAAWHNGGPCSPTCDCPGNANGDNAVDVNDLLATITNWGSARAGCPGIPCAGDVTHNCAVDVNDLLLVITKWGPCPQ